MKKVLTQKQAMRYSRQILLPDFDLDNQEKLLNAKVLIVGVGGLGCAAAQYLVAAGVQYLTLVDHDLVESSNLQRQVLHGEHSLGINKCVSAKQALLKLDSQANIDCVTHKLDDSYPPSFYATHDLVLDCTDNLETRNLLNFECYNAGVPLVSGAAIRMEGQLFSISPNDKSACYLCLSRFFSEQQLTCVEAGVMSPVVGVIGAMQALQGIKLICDYGDKKLNTLMTFDGLTMQWNQFKVDKNATCKVCSGA